MVTFTVVRYSTYFTVTDTGTDSSRVSEPRRVIGVETTPSRELSDSAIVQLADKKASC